LKKNNVQVDVLSYDMDDQKLNPVDIQREAAADLVTRFAALKPRPSALFVASEIGPYVHLELVNRGIVPMQDVCLIAGDLNICAQFALSPKPLAWRVHSQNIGYQAVEMLLARIKNPHLPQLTTYLRPRLHMPEQS
jgi:DNA-binding LacI/PurR family transcriptional regulator